MRHSADHHRAAHLPCERERIRRIATGDAEAFRTLVRDYHPVAYRLACSIVDDPQDAEEVVQDAFFKIHRALDSFRGEASLKTWILRIVMRLSLNRRRDQARTAWRRMGLHQAGANLEETRQTPAAHSQSPETQYISGETRRQILALIDQLPESLRQVLLLNSLEELSYEEISRILDIPLGTVGSRMYNARKKLLRSLKGCGLL